MRLGLFLCVAGIFPSLAAPSLLGLFRSQALQAIIPGELLPSVRACRDIIADGPEFGYGAGREPVRLDRFRKLLQSVKILLNYALVNPESIAEPGTVSDQLQRPAIKLLGRALCELLNVRHSGLLWQGLPAPGFLDECDEGLGQADRPSSLPKLERSIVSAELDVQQWTLVSILQILERKLSPDQPIMSQFKLVAAQTDGLAELCTVRGLIRQLDGEHGDAVKLVANLCDHEFRSILFTLEKELGGLPKMLRNVWIASQSPAAVEMAMLKEPFKWERWLQTKSVLQIFYRGVHGKREHLSRRMIKISEVMDRAIAMLKVEAIRLRARLELSSVREWAERAAGKLVENRDRVKAKADESLERILQNNFVEAARLIEEGLAASAGLSLNLSEALDTENFDTLISSMSVALFELVRAMWESCYQPRGGWAEDIVSWDGLAPGLEKITAMLDGINRMLEAGMERREGLERDQFVLSLLSGHFGPFVSGTGMLIKTLEATKDPKMPLEECRQAYDRLLAHLDGMVAPMADGGEDEVVVMPSLLDPPKHTWESIFGDLQQRK